VFGYLGRALSEGGVGLGVAICSIARCALKNSIRGVKPAFSRRSHLVLQQTMRVSVVVVRIGVTADDTDGRERRNPNDEGQANREGGESRAHEPLCAHRLPKCVCVITLSFRLDCAIDRQNGLGMLIVYG
jgi:hypothetical protein